MFRSAHSGSFLKNTAHCKYKNLPNYMKVWKGVQDRNTLHSAPDVKLTIYDSNKLLVGEKKKC